MSFTPVLAGATFIIVLALAGNKPSGGITTCGVAILYIATHCLHLLLIRKELGPS